MMRKKIMIMAMILIIMGGMAYSAAVFNTINDMEKVLVTIISQEPDPVAPGQTVDVYFRIENLKTEPIKNVEVMLEPKYPFSIYGQESEIRQIGTLAGGQGGEIGVRVKYTLLVDANAAEGENELDFYYRVNGGGWIRADDFMVDVRTRDAVLAINEIKTDCDKILPGSTTKVTFMLENLADSVLKDIKLKLDIYEAATTATSWIYNELPFTPMGSGNEKTVDRIFPKKAKEISFDLFTDADAESKAYKVPYVLTYADEAGYNFTRSGILGLMVDAEPDVSVNIDSTTIYSAGSTGTIGIKFVNKGFSDIKFLDIILKETQDFDLLSNPEVYIGNVDSDDYETADYTLFVKKDTGSPMNLPLKVEYRDANGKLYSRDMSMELELFSGNELKQRVGNGNNSFVGLIVIIVIIVAGIVIYRIWKKKRWEKGL